MLGNDEGYMSGDMGSGISCSSPLEAKAKPPRFVHEQVIRPEEKTPPIGSGTSGRVFPVAGSSDTRALKVLNTKDVEQVARELVVYRMLASHPQVGPKCWSFVVGPESTHIELERGAPLHTLPHSQRTRYTAQLLALYTAWSALGLYHCDIKPQNFVVVGTQLRVIDWGSCHFLASFLVPFNRRTCYSRLFRHPAVFATKSRHDVSPSVMETWELWAVACTLVMMHQPVATITALDSYQSCHARELRHIMHGDTLAFVLDVLEHKCTTRQQALTYPVFRSGSATAGPGQKPPPTPRSTDAPLASRRVSACCSCAPSPTPWSPPPGYLWECRLPKSTLLHVARVLLEVERGGCMGVVINLLHLGVLAGEVMVKRDTYEAAVMYAALMVLEQFRIPVKAFRALSGDKGYILRAVPALAMRILCAVPAAAWWPLLNQGPFMEFAQTCSYLRGADDDFVTLAVHGYVYAYLLGQLECRPCFAEDIRDRCLALVDGRDPFWGDAAVDVHAVERIRLRAVADQWLKPHK